MNTLPGLIGKKLGFTQVFDAAGNVARVTVVEATEHDLIAVLPGYERDD